MVYPDQSSEVGFSSVIGKSVAGASPSHAKPPAVRAGPVKPLQTHKLSKTRAIIDDKSFQKLA